MLRVVVCDDEQLLREALTKIIDAAADLSVVGVAANGQEAVTAVDQHAPDVVLMYWTGSKRPAGSQAAHESSSSRPMTSTVTSMPPCRPVPAASC